MKTMKKNWKIYCDLQNVRMNSLKLHDLLEPYNLWQRMCSICVVWIRQAATNTPTTSTSFALHMQKENTFMFKTKNNISSIYSTDLFNSPPLKGLRSSTHSHFFMNPLNHTYAESYCGPFFTLLSNLTSLLSFREALKTHLFKQFLAERS